MPIIRNIIQPIIRPIINGITGAIRRVFITLDPEAFARYELASPWVATGDFEIEFDFVTSGSSTDMSFLGKDADARGFIRLSNGTPSINWSAASAQNTFGATDYRDGLLHSAKVTLTSGTVEFIVDGVSQGTAIPADVSNTNFEVIGAKNGGAYFDGIISNVRLTDLSTPSNSESYALNQLTGNTETSNGNTLTYVMIAETIDIRDTFTLVTEGWTGSELVVNGSFDTDTAWSKGVGWSIAGGVANCDGTQVSNSDLSQSQTLLEVGQKYSVDITVSNYTAGVLAVVLIGLGVSANITANGEYQFIITADGGNASKPIIIRADSNFVGSINNISVKQLIEVA